MSELAGQSRGGQSMQAGGSDPLTVPSQPHLQVAAQALGEHRHEEAGHPQHQEAACQPGNVWLLAQRDEHGICIRGGKGTGSGYLGWGRLLPSARRE